jgi:hypothetical protein
VERVHAALQDRQDAVVDVVLLDSDQTSFQARSDLENRKYFADRGVIALDEAWLRAHLGNIDVVVLPDAYDASRPRGLCVNDFAEAGIRLVYLPCQPPAAESSLANVCAWRERDRNV